MNPDSKGPIYCAEQIQIPPELPDILKEFTKAAIRTQPTDLLQWSAAYFQALARGEVPPVKDRLEHPLPSTEERLGGITKGALAVLHKQLGPKETVVTDLLREKWQHVGCAQSKLDELLAIGDFPAEQIEWQKLLALACTALEKTLPEALQTLCEVLTPDPEGGAARVPLEQFHRLYSFLAEVDGEIAREQVEAVMQFLSNEASDSKAEPNSTSSLNKQTCDLNHAHSLTNMQWSALSIGKHLLRAQEAFPARNEPPESDRYGGSVGPREFLHPSCPRVDSRLT